MTSEGEIVLHESKPWHFKTLKTQAEWEKYFFRFPDTDGVNTVTIDKSPAWFELSDGPTIARKYLPGSKIVLTVCDPAERTVSEYHHLLNFQHNAERLNASFTDKGMTPPADFDEFSDILSGKSPKCKGRKEGCEMLRDQWFEKSNYVGNIQRWRQYYDQDEILVIDMTAPKEENAKRLVEFAGLPLDEYPWHDIPTKQAYVNPNYKGRGAAWEDSPKAMKFWANLFAPYNRALANYIGESFPLQWRSTQDGVADDKMN